ncbi:hypothetical protein II5_05346, partial [Bacillus cereus MSX-A1]
MDAALAEFPTFCNCSFKTRACLKTVVHCVNRKIAATYTKAKKEVASLS